MTLKELLNKLIDKWFNPFGWYKNSTHWETCNWVYGKWVVFWCDDSWEWDWKTQDYTLRELVSVESGLWQFCVENGMVWRWDRITKRKKVKDTDSRSWEEVIYYSVIWSYNETDYQYRLIESALTDESELEEFLLSNINTNVENRW